MGSFLQADDRTLLNEASSDTFNEYGDAQLCSSEVDLHYFESKIGYQGTEPDELGTRQATFFGGVMNLANTTLGAGILALPSAFSQCGYVLGTLMLCTGACCSAFSLWLLGRCAHKIGGSNTSFHAVSCHTFPNLSFLVDIAVAIKCFGVATSYLVVIGDTLPAVAEALIGPVAPEGTSFLIKRQFWISVVMAVFITPMTCMKHLYALRYTSFLAVASVCYVTLLVVAYNLFPSLDPCPAGVSPADCHGPVEAVVARLSVFHALPVFVFSFTCHQNTFTIYNEMAVPRAGRLVALNKVIATTIGLVLTLYLVISNCGYNTFGNQVAPNLLESYSLTSPAVLLARCTMAIVVICCYPLQCHPCRHAVTALVFNFCDQLGISRPPSNILYYTLTVLHLLGSYIIALSVTNLGTVFAMVGATGSTLISLVLPGLFFYKMFEPHPEAKGLRTASLCLAVGGLLIMCCSVLFLLLPPTLMCRVLEPHSRAWQDSGCL